MNWYYLTEEGEVAGPVSQKTLEELRGAGALNDETQVCAEGTENWQQFKLALSTTADNQKPALVPKQMPQPDHEEAENSEVKTVLLGSDSPASSNSDQSAENSRHASTSSPSSNGALRNFADSLCRIVKVSVAPIKRIAISISKETTHTPGTTKPIDRRFITGILVAIGCTTTIVLAIVSTRGDSKTPPDDSNPAAVQSPPTQHSTTPAQVEYYPCGRCRGSGQLQGQCTRCRGNGTIMTGNPNSLDPLQSRIPSMQVPCPQCRGGGRMAVPCSHCRGLGRQ